MSLRFIKVSNPQPVIDYLVSTIRQRLEDGERLLWLIPGGSAIEIVVAVSKQLRGKELSNLTVTLTDERYGPVGHPDSNWQQLNEAGFSLAGANLQPVLLGKDFDATVIDYSKTIAKDLRRRDYKLGFIGIGADGHTAGIKPASKAVSSAEWVIGYNSQDYLRLTITPRTISQLDQIVSYAIGASKHEALNQLESNLPVTQQPAQCLKTTNKTCIYNDYKGEEI